jgi:hypothetical protein
MVPVAWLQMTKKGWVRKDRDPERFCLPNRSAGERCEQRETSKADELRKPFTKNATCSRSSSGLRIFCHSVCGRES